MQIKKLALSVAAVSALGVFSSANAYTTHEEQIIVHPFQWTYDMIADEADYRSSVPVDLRYDCRRM